MPAASLKEILDRAFAERYGVAAFNIVDDLTMGAVIDAAAELRAPVIVQTSVKTVKAIGARFLAASFRERAAASPAPVALHLDHCPDRAIITLCLENGWSSVLFDGSALGIDDNRRQTTEVVAEARAHGAHVEGEIEQITGVEDGVGSEYGSDQYPLEIALDFIRTTGIDCFAPAIGTAHGFYSEAPRLDAERVSAIVAAEPLPIVLHGGTGLSQTQFDDLVSRGCAKVNISTALKQTFMRASTEYLEGHPGALEPLPLLDQVRAETKTMALTHITQLGGAGRAS